jgi:hypothetical protein
MPVQMTPVDGSNIKAIGYDSGSHQLHIDFSVNRIDGKKKKKEVPVRYIFDDVPAPLHGAFMDAKSKGAFFHSNIKGFYSFTRVEPEHTTKQ